MRKLYSGRAMPIEIERGSHVCYTRELGYILATDRKHAEQQFSFRLKKGEMLDRVKVIKRTIKEVKEMEEIYRLYEPINHWLHEMIHNKPKK